MEEQEGDGLVRKVEIRYKSGHMITAWFSLFKVTRTGNGGLNYTWHTANPEQEVCHIGADDIESAMIVAIVPEEMYYP